MHGRACIKQAAHTLRIRKKQYNLSVSTRARITSTLMTRLDNAHQKARPTPTFLAWKLLPLFPVLLFPFNPQNKDVHGTTATIQVAGRFIQNKGKLIHPKQAGTCDYVRTWYYQLLLLLSLLSTNNPKIELARSVTRSNFVLLNYLMSNSLLLYNRTIQILLHKADLILTFKQFTTFA